MATAFPFFSSGRRICDNSKYGDHITLRCKNHPELTWSTKNIECIGGRSIFFSANWHQEEPTEYKKECNCPIGDLYHDCKDDRKE